MTGCGCSGKPRLSGGLAALKVNPQPSRRRFRLSSDQSCPDRCGSVGVVVVAASLLPLFSLPSFCRPHHPLTHWQPCGSHVTGWMETALTDTVILASDCRLDRHSISAGHSLFAFAVTHEIVRCGRFLVHEVFGDERVREAPCCCCAAAAAPAEGLLTGCALPTPLQIFFLSASYGPRRLARRLSQRDTFRVLTSRS